MTREKPKIKAKPAAKSASGSPSPLRGGVRGGGNPGASGGGNPEIGRRSAIPLPQEARRAPKPAPKPVVSSGFWLMKSEPDVFGWDDLVKRGKGGEPWTGVRNYQARNNMRAMQVGDLAFFYHSNIGKEIAGVMRVVAPAHPDQTDDTGAWECVDVAAVMPLAAPLTLEAIKADPKLSSMALVNNSRLSVQPVTAPEWAHLCKLAGIDAKALKK